MSREEITLEFLDNFAEAWKRHDTDAILAAMTDDAVMTLSAGTTAEGSRFVGKDELRKGIDGVFDLFADAMWNGATHFVAGDRGVSEWVFTGTRVDGSRVEAQGCDIFTFRDGKIALKNSFRKQRSP